MFTEEPVAQGEIVGAKGRTKIAWLLSLPACPWCTWSVRLATKAVIFFTSALFSWVNTWDNEWEALTCFGEIARFSLKRHCIIQWVTRANCWTLLKPLLDHIAVAWLWERALLWALVVVVVVVSIKKPRIRKVSIFVGFLWQLNEWTYVKHKKECLYRVSTLYVLLLLFENCIFQSGCDFVFHCPKGAHHCSELSPQILLA